MSTTQQPEALRDARWYMVNKDGMATLCTDKADAEKEAEDAQIVWPHMGPHRAVQLVEAADIEALQAGYAAARLEIESLQARIKTMAEEHADELTVAHLDGRMRAAQPLTTQRIFRAMRAAIAKCGPQANGFTAPQADSVLEDAARYRWLRQHSLAAGQGSITVELDDRANGHFSRSIFLAELDAAIDAARAAQEGKA